MAVEIRSEIELEEWLKDKPVDWAQAIAVRAALRVFPILLREVCSPKNAFSIEQYEYLLLQNFRTIISSWTVTKYYESHRLDSLLAFEAVSSSAYALLSITKRATFLQETICNSISNAAQAVAYALGPDVSAGYGNAGISDEFASGKNVLPFALAAVASASASSQGADAWKAVSTDAHWLSEQEGNSSLVDQALWLIEDESTIVLQTNFPRSFWSALGGFHNDEYWGKTKNWRLLPSWYLSLIPNIDAKPRVSAFGEKADVKIALMPDEFWTITKDRGAEQILREIAEIAGIRAGDNLYRDGEQRDAGGDLAELEADIETAIANIEPQAPAAYRFEVRNGKIAALPQADVSTDPRGAQTMLDEARHKAVLLKERLDRSNAEQRVKTSVDGLLDALPEQISDLDEYRLRSRFRSIEADARAYEHDEAELFPDAVAALIDLSETLRDLQGFYPNLRNMEAEVEAIEIPIAQIDDALDLADTVVDAVDAVPEAVDDSVSDAVHEMGKVPREQATASVRQKRAAEYWLVVRNLASTVFRGAIDNALTREAKALGSDAYKTARPKIVEAPGMIVQVSVVLLAAKLAMSFGMPEASEIIITMGFAKIFNLAKLAEKLIKKNEKSGKRDADSSDKDTSKSSED